MAMQRSVPPKLSLPPRPVHQQLVGSARFYPTFTPSARNSFIFSPSPTPTPSKRPRSPQGPLWLFTLLHLLPLYSLHQWLSSSSSPPPLALVTFLSLLGSALFLNIIYRSWKGRPILPSQWGLLAGSGGILALSCLLRFQGLGSCGPLETIFADFVGSVLAKILLDSSKKSSGTIRKARGLIALLVGTFLLSQGWARASCSPLAFDVGYRARAKIISQPKDCVKVWSIFVPTLGGFLSAIQRSMGSRQSLRIIGKKRVHVLSYAVGALILLPFAMLQAALMAGQSQWQLSRSLWPLSSTVAFGMVVGFFGDFYAEEKLLMPSHSLKAFQIVTCCACGLELLYGLDISLVGFLFCSFVLGIGVQELAFLPGQLTWEALGDTEYNTSVYAAWVKSPLQHIMSDKKSRKIAIFLIINTGFMVIEFFYGFLCNSLGLISDACHMLFDCAALAIGLYASYISHLPENSKFNYGYGRFEVVSGYANAVLLVLVASLIVLESIERILEPPAISTESLLLVSVGGLLVNLVGLIFFHEEHHHAHGGGGGCSHSHSSLEGHVSSAPGLHNNAVGGDHSVIACGATFYKDSEGDISLSAFPAGKIQTDEHQHAVGHDHCHHQHLANDVNHDCHNHNHDDHTSHDHHDHHSHDHHDHHSHDHHDHHSHDHHDHYHGQDHGHDHHQNLHHSKDQCHDHGGCSESHSILDAHNVNHDCQNHDHHHGHGHNHGHSHDHGHDQDDHHDHAQHHHMDHNMYGIFLHVLADTLGSVGVVISTILIKYKGWLITDPACSIFLSALIIASVVPLLRNSAEILLQRVPRYCENDLKKAFKDISRIVGVKSAQRVHVWSFTNTNVIGSLHLQISAGSDKQSIQRNVSRLLRDAGIGDLTLQIEEI